MPQRSSQPPGQWSHGLFDCSDSDSCMEAFCCPCIVFGRTADRMRDPTGQTHEKFNHECKMLFCVGSCYSAGERSKMREKYNIEGSTMNDWCVSCWCLPCTIVQQDQEVTARQGGGKNVNTTGYQANQGMEMSRH